MNTLPCPRCRVDLISRRVPGGLAWVCGRCKGACFNLALLRRQGEQAVVSALWNLANETPIVPARSCPSCTTPMCTCSTSGLELDVCRACQLVWFDTSETEAFGAKLEPALTKEASVSVALAQSEALAEGASIQKKISAIRFFLLGIYQHLGERQ